MARQFRLAWKIILVSAVMLVIGFLAGYNSETRHQIKSNKSSATNNVYPEVPNRELWDDKKTHHLQNRNILRVF